jgi:hypothetical protein
MERRSRGRLSNSMADDFYFESTPFTYISISRSALFVDQVRRPKRCRLYADNERHERRSNDVGGTG